jgi:hypothetical protein
MYDSSGDRLARWADKLEIEQVLRRWCRGLDRCDEALMRSTYHPDATDEHGEYVSDGISAPGSFIARHRSAFKRHLHLVLNVLVDLDGDRARSESQVMGLLVPNESGPERVIASAGRFLDCLERRDGDWRFVRRRWVREAVFRVDQFPHDAYAAFVRQVPDASYGHLMPYTGHRSRDDPSYAYLPPEIT